MCHPAGRVAGRYFQGSSSVPRPYVTRVRTSTWKPAGAKAQGAMRAAIAAAAAARHSLRRGSQWTVARHDMSKHSVQWTVQAACSEKAKANVTLWKTAVS